MDTRNIRQIWLTWDNQIDVRTSGSSRVFRSVTDKANARGDTEAEVNRVKEAAEPLLDSEFPGYEWTIEPDGYGPSLRYLIRGDRKT